ncbi:MAG: SDR family NAD(P)-dependent oxidoreductase [Clostridia bacterium]|nr:SDR family NAD(P)-dependent oxidoreductase [Clostridia bacterium]
MNYNKWYENNTKSLKGKLVAVTGATGGIGKELCFHLARLEADLVLLNRSREKTETLINELKKEFGSISVSFVPLDLESIESVDNAVLELESNCPDIFIHNAGAYSIPRHKTSLGIDNVFQINCISPYYLTSRLFQALKENNSRVIVVGSIAHNYSKTDVNDIDFSKRSAASKVYGNAKRRLMLSEYERFKNEREVTLSVCHPGITLTNITAHYPKIIFALIKHPMKLIFMSPKKASLCILKGIFEECAFGEWIGPRFFGIWGLPKRTALKTFEKSESQRVFAETEELLNNRLKNQVGKQ